MENEVNEFTPQEKPKSLKVIKIILRVCLGLIIFAAIALPVSRIFVLDIYPGEVTKYIWTERAAQVYKTDKDSIRIFDIYVGQNYGKLGLFFNAYIRLTDSRENDISEFQLTVRYNDSTIKQLAKTETVNDEDDPFIYVLCTDMGDAYIPSIIKETSKSNLNYRRLVFEDVNMVDVDLLYLNIYSKNVTSYDDVIEFYKSKEIKGADEEAFSYMPVYSSKNANEEYTLGSDELPND